MVRLVRYTWYGWYGTHGTVHMVRLVRLVRHIGTASPVGTVHWHNKFENHTWARCVTRIVPCAMCRYNISVLYRTVPYICTMTSSCVPYHVPYHVPRYLTVLSPCAPYRTIYTKTPNGRYFHFRHLMKILVLI